MPVSILGRVFVSERHNMRMPERLEASMRSGVSARPILNEVEVQDDVEPLLVTNADCRFVPTRVSRARGTARYAFSEVPLDDEPKMLAEMYMALLDASLSQGWSNRCNSVSEAVDRLRSSSIEPAFLIVPETVLPDICGPQYDPAQTAGRMMKQGYVAVVDKMKVLPADLSPGSALVLASPSFFGLYTRVGDYLGVMIQRADRSVMVVGDGVA
jgi:hypothetical protein